MSDFLNTNQEQQIKLSHTFAILYLSFFASVKFCRTLYVKKIYVSLYVKKIFFYICKLLSEQRVENAYY